MTRDTSRPVDRQIGQGLQGRTVLLVEDDYFQGLAVAECLEAAGAVVVGPVRRVEHALSAVDQGRIDYALLDIDLGSGLDFALARGLQQRELPFMFLTGYAENAIPDEFHDVARCTKPMSFRDLPDLLGRAVEKAAA